MCAVGLTCCTTVQIADYLGIRHALEVAKERAAAAIVHIVDVGWHVHWQEALRLREVRDWHVCTQLYLTRWPQVHAFDKIVHVIGMSLANRKND